MKKNFLSAAILLSVMLLSACKKETTTTTPPVIVPEVFNDNDNMLMGNPSNAAAVLDSVNNYLLRKPEYSSSYNSQRGTPNWVSWHLFQNDIGSVNRAEDFLPDNTLPAAWYHIYSTHYNGSGFDRGHNCPSGDRTATLEANTATFLMTNVIPQAPQNNQLTWSNMEQYIRSQVSGGNEAYIIMGSYGVGGTGSEGFKTTIGGGHVTVPANIWKVVVLIPNANNDTTRVTAATRVITVDVPNNNTVNSNWKLYRTSVDAIEAATGYNLLSRLPLAVQTAVEAVVDNQ